MKLLLVLFFKDFIYLEREHEEGKVQRERKGKNPKRALHWGRSPHNPETDLSRDQELATQLTEPPGCPSEIIIIIILKIYLF